MRIRSSHFKKDYDLHKAELVGKGTFAEVPPTNPGFSHLRLRPQRLHRHSKSQEEHGRPGRYRQGKTHQ